MVKLDPSLLRFFDDEDFRVLTALEMTTRNHEIAPTVLIERIAQLPHGGCRKRLKALLKHKVIHHENTAYDGYGMKYAAFDFLALRTLAKRGTVAGVGCRIGCGKESDIFLIEDDHNQEAVLKLQRLGRCSFRSVARNRDYKNGKQRRGASWFYLSRLAATKEFAFMKMLYDEGFPVPKPIDHNRHAIVMEYVKGTLLNHITSMEKADAAKVYHRCVSLVVKLAQHGLIHGDFNEFNCFVTDDFHIVLIDFPQMVSTDHKNAIDLFNRDIQNLAAFFSRRFKVDELLYPALERDVERVGELDRQLMASGFAKGDQQRLEELLAMNEEEESEEEEEEEEEEDGEPTVPSEQSERHLTVKHLPNYSNSEADQPAAEVTEEEFEQVANEAKETGPVPEDEEEAEEDEEGSEESDDEQTRQKLRTERVKVRNPNFIKGGQINLEHIKKRVKAKAQYEDDRSFNQSLHRNTQKGRDKSSIRRKIKGVKDLPSANDW